MKNNKAIDNSIRVATSSGALLSVLTLSISAPVQAETGSEQSAQTAIEEVVVTDSIPNDGRDLGPKVKILSVAPLLGEAIKRIHEERSLSSLFV